MNNLNKDEMLTLLRRYEEAYYSGESKVSDEEYDALKAIYVEQYGEYDFVPNEGEVEHFVKTRHLHPLKSLDKYQINDEEGLRKELNRLWPIIIQDKFDGLSIEIQYVDNKLKFITRGDGEIGDDVTAQCMQIKGVEFLADLFTNEEQSFRAEILMTHSDFAKLNKVREEAGEELLSNCRNAASGMLRNKDLSKVEGLTLMLYEDLGSINNETSDLNDMYEILSENIKGTDIRISSYYEPKDIDEAIRYLNELETRRRMIDYDIDGWVVKSNKHNSLKLFGGYTGHHPKNAFAVKGEAKGAWTPIKSITWQVGKESITPVAELEPVEIDGSIISRATLHNVSFLKAIDLTMLEYEDKYGTKPLTQVKVIKANDVIPRIIEVKHHLSKMPESFEGFKPGEIANFNIGNYCNIIHPPTKCPVCGADTAIKDTDSDSEILICTGAECKAKLQARILQMCSRDGLNIAGMSQGTIKKFLDTYDIEKPSDILDATYEDILNLEGFAERSAQKLYDSIQNAIKEQPINKIIYASAIPLVGKSAAKDICEHFSIEEIALIFSVSEKKAIELLLEVKDVGEATAKSLIANKEIIRELHKRIEKSIDIKSNKSKTTNQLTFCITGQREPFKTIIESAGHKVSSSVSKKTSALINANNETSSKATKAKDLGIPVITTEKELRKFLDK